MLYENKDKITAMFQDRHYSGSRKLYYIKVTSTVDAISGLWSRSRRESEVSGWSQSRNPKTTRSRSRNF